MILVSNPPQNENSELFFLWAFLVTLHVIISPIHPVPKKKVPITLNLEHTMGEKRTDFCSFQFVNYQDSSPFYLEFWAVNRPNWEVQLPHGSTL